MGKLLSGCTLSGSANVRTGKSASSGTTDAPGSRVASKVHGVSRRSVAGPSMTASAAVNAMHPCKGGSLSKHTPFGSAPSAVP